MDSVIKLLREQNHYTQTRLAEDLGISRQALIKYENMELVNLNSFGCGLDAIITDQAEEI